MISNKSVPFFKLSGQRGRRGRVLQLLKLLLLLVVIAVHRLLLTVLVLVRIQRPDWIERPRIVRNEGWNGRDGRSLSHCTGRWAA